MERYLSGGYQQLRNKRIRGTLIVYLRVSIRYNERMEKSVPRYKQHGTVNCYRAGCRCEPCKKEKADYNARTGVARKTARKRAGCEDISERECIALWNKQGKKCAICAKRMDWPNKDIHVDHNHATGKVRGILCSRCNRAMGLFKDNPVVLAKAAQYSKRS